MFCETRGHHSRHRRHASHHNDACGCGCRCDCDCERGCGCGCGCGCNCGRGGGFERRFLTKEEKIAELQEYLESLQKEAQAVEEHIAALRGE